MGANQMKIVTEH